MVAETSKCKITTYCKFCKALGIKRLATRRSRYAPRLYMRDYYKHYACDDHAHLIEDTDPDRTRKAECAKQSAKDSADHMTEADFQTWWNL